MRGPSCEFTGPWLQDAETWEVTAVRANLTVVLVKYLKLNLSESSVKFSVSHVLLVTNRHSLWLASSLSLSRANLVDRLLILVINLEWPGAGCTILTLVTGVVHLFRVHKRHVRWEDTSQRHNASNRKNWILENLKIVDFGTKPVILKYCRCTTYCKHLTTAGEITQQES